MRVAVIHENGKQLVFPVTQVVVYNDDGEPCAITYPHGGLMLHTDRSHEDFEHACQVLRIKALTSE
jgi:hypothetical protein